MNAGYRILEHPADLGIEAWGRTVGEAYEQAAEALVAVLVDPETVSACTEVTVDVSAEDLEHLLVRWLSEILYQLDGRGFVPRRVSVQRVDETGLSATLRGEQLDLARHSTRTDVKAITYHQLSVQESRQGVVLRVFVDI